MCYVDLRLKGTFLHENKPKTLLMYPNTPFSQHDSSHKHFYFEMVMKTYFRERRSWSNRRLPDLPTAPTEMLLHQRNFGPLKILYASSNKHEIFKVSFSAQNSVGKKVKRNWNCLGGRWRAPASVRLEMCHLKVVTIVASLSRLMVQNTKAGTVNGPTKPPKSTEHCLLQQIKHQCAFLT